MLTNFRTAFQIAVISQIVDLLPFQIDIAYIKRKKTVTIIRYTINLFMHIYALIFPKFKFPK